MRFDVESVIPRVSLNLPLDAVAEVAPAELPVIEAVAVYVTYKGQQ